MTIEEFLHDYGSTTLHFKKWSDSYHLDILDQRIVGDFLQRLVLIWVDKIPVMLGLSETELNNTVFVDILQNAGVVPIGVRLFAPESGIKRVQAHVGQINTNMITNVDVINYLTRSNISGQIYFRQSNFTVDKQTMTLKEYILPGLIDLLAIQTN